MAQMNNDVFVDKLINLTKSGKLSWESGEEKAVELANGVGAFEKSFYFDNADKRINIVYFQSEDNDFINNDFYCLEINTLGDSKHPIQFYKNDFVTSNILERLFRLAERSARKVDEVLTQIISSIDKEDAPF